ncbi:MAG: MFS transporter [Parcubacteria group bacterium]
MNLSEKKDRIFGFRRNVFFLGLVSLFNDFSNEMIQSVMPVFLSVTLGVPPVFVGIFEGIADAVASFLKIISGYVSDRIHKRKSLAIIGYMLSVAVRPIYAIASSFGRVLSIRIIDRVGKGFREAPRDALLSESVEKKELGKSFSFQRAMDSIGGIAGPLSAFLILPLFGGNNYRPLFFIAFGIGLLALMSFVFIKDAPVDSKRPPMRFNMAIFKKNKKFALFLLAIFVFGMGTLPITLMLLRPIEIGSSLANIPLLYLIYSLVFVIAAVPFGKLSDKIGERFIIPFGFVSAIACYFILGTAANSIWTAVLAFALFGIYSAATDGIGRALTTKLVDPDLLATGQGFLQTAIGVSSLLAGLIGGLLWTKFDAFWAFAYGATFAALGLIIFLVINFLPRRQV